MSNIEVKLTLKPGEFNTIVALLKARWDDRLGDLKSHRDSYCEYRSMDAKANGEPERLSKWHVTAGTKALVELREMADLADLFGLDNEIPRERIGLLHDVEEALAIQELEQSVEATVSN
jgi:hypothetical protein